MTETELCVDIYGQWLRANSPAEGPATKDVRLALLAEMVKLAMYLQVAITREQTGERDGDDAPHQIAETVQRLASFWLSIEMIDSVTSEQTRPAAPANLYNEEIPI